MFTWGNWLYVAYLWDLRVIYVVGTYIVTTWKNESFSLVFFLSCICSNVRSTCTLYYLVTWPIIVMLHLISIILTQEKQWCHCWCFWHHAVPIPVPVVSHDQKSNVPYFLDLRNAMVPLTVMLASCDDNTGGNGVSDQKINFAISFDLCWSKECSGVTGDAVGRIWHSFQCKWHQIPEMLHVILIVLT